MRPRRRFGLVLTALLLARLADASGAPSPSPAASPSPESPREAELGQTFELHVGESARLDEGRLTVRFVEVASDSRCPRSVQCVWAGDATVVVELQPRGGEAQQVELHTSPRFDRSASAAGHVVALVALEPYPEREGGLAPEDYVACLQVGRN